MMLQAAWWCRGIAAQEAWHPRVGVTAPRASTGPSGKTGSPSASPRDQNTIKKIAT